MDLELHRRHPADAGQASACYFRSKAPGALSLVASSDAGLTGSTQAVTVTTTSLTDDFERATLFIWESPAGPWDAYSAPVAQNSLVVSSTAAHRGIGGALLTDARGQNHLVFHSADVSGDYYFRTWLRISSTNGAGAFVPLQVMDWKFGYTALTDFVLTYPGPVISVGGFDSTLAYSTDSPGVVFPTGWHLVEVATLGVGSSSGSRKVWVDGALVASRTVNWTGMHVNLIALGEPWSGDTAFRGTLDDVRTASVPLASQVALGVGGGPLHPGACITLDVALRDTPGAALAPAPFAVDVSLSSSGVPGRFFSDPGCEAMKGTVTIARGRVLQARLHRRRHAHWLDGGLLVEPCRRLRELGKPAVRRVSCDAHRGGVDDALGERRPRSVLVVAVERWLWRLSVEYRRVLGGIRRWRGGPRSRPRYRRDFRPRSCVGGDGG